jgi:hypothetical protein
MTKAVIQQVSYVIVLVYILYTYYTVRYIHIDSKVV